MFRDIINQQAWPEFRGKQINHAVFKELISDWEEATSLPKEIRAYLAAEVKLSSIEAVDEKISNKKDTIKTLFKLKDGHLIEAVLMMHHDRNTVCVSSQSGCPVGCKFCATGAMGFKRNLTAKEIVDQVLYFARKIGKTTPPYGQMVGTGRDLSLQQINNIVFMGMGEPMLNMKNVAEAVEILTDDLKFGLGKRKITVSTSGYIKQLIKFLNKWPHIGLAVSLHAPTQALREKLMPNVAKTNKIHDLLQVCRDYSNKTKRRVSYEYILIEGVNDNLDDARKLAEILYGHLFFVNLIPYNFSTTPKRPDGLCCPSSNKEGNCLELSTTVTEENCLELSISEKDDDCLRLSSLSRRSRKRSVPEVVSTIGGVVLKRPNSFRVNKFKEELNRLGVPVAVRVAMGADIGGACGQLSSMRPRRTRLGREK